MPGDTQELQDYLNAQDAAGLPKRRLHRLAPQAYSDAQCCYFFTLCARQHGLPFIDPVLASAIVGASVAA
jgi:hypothetical protein